MRVSVNCKSHDFEPGTKLAHIVAMTREATKNDPMIRTIKEKTGKDHIVFIVNGRVVRAPEYDILEIREGDDIRWVHPYFGG